MSEWHANNSAAQPPGSGSGRKSALTEGIGGLVDEGGAIRPAGMPAGRLTDNKVLCASRHVRLCALSPPPPALSARGVWDDRVVALPSRAPYCLAMSAFV